MTTSAELVAGLAPLLSEVSLTAPWELIERFATLKREHPDDVRRAASASAARPAPLGGRATAAHPARGGRRLPPDGVVRSPRHPGRGGDLPEPAGCRAGRSARTPGAREAPGHEPLLPRGAQRSFALCGHRPRPPHRT